SRPVEAQTLYDIASVTKLFTTTALLIAARESKVEVGDRLPRFPPEFKTSDKEAITLRDLMQHNSGIKIAIQALAEVSPDEWIARIAEAPLHAAPTTKVLYSCTNFFLLARVAEKLAGAQLDDFIAARVLQPMQMTRTTWFPLRHFALDEIAPTEIQNDVATHGIVHDEAARAWQEYSGHASCGNSGLFSTAADLAKFAGLWSGDGTFNGHKILEESAIEEAFNDTVPELDPVAKRGLGWQLDARFYMGEKAPADVAGHSGFTGPTLWLSRSTRHICVILNNRVYPTRETASRFPTHRRVARWLMNAGAQHR